MLTGIRRHAALTAGPGGAVAPVIPVGGVSFPTHVATRKRTVYERFFKRGMDLVLALFLLTMALPLMLLVAIAVRASLGKQVVYSQPRVGLDGRIFTLRKFRTMRADRRVADVAIDHDDRRKVHKHPNDPRVTKVGRILRKWSLDELPQLWNVVRGDMSLVGPRPELLFIVNKYAPWQHERHVVRPGLTGLWQVVGRGNGQMHENTQIDIEYAKRVALHTDLYILLLTVPAVLFQRQGY